MKFVDESLLPEPPIGAHLVSPRRGFKHHGLYIGRGKVVHYSGMARSFGLKELRHIISLVHYGSIVKTSLKQFCDGHGFYVVEHPHARFPGELAVDRAKKRLCERSYYIYSNNCEHFVNWCIEDEFKSPFVTRILLMTAFLLGSIQWGISGRAVRSGNETARLTFGTLTAIFGAYASLFFTSQALSPAHGMRGRERKNRTIGRIGMRAGALLGILFGVLGAKKQSRAALSLSPYFLPVISGLTAYWASRSIDTRRRVNLRKRREKSEKSDA